MSDARQPKIYLLPNLMTAGNLFCGFAAVLRIYDGAQETDFLKAASDFHDAIWFILAACIFDLLDGRLARLGGHESPFGREFDSLADIVSFGMAPAVLSFQWGLSSLGRLGWAAGFFFVAAAALRLSRFNIQSGGDKRYFVGMPSPPAAGIPAATVYLYPTGLTDYRAALPTLAMVLIPAVLMVSTIRFRSFKHIDLQVRRSYTVLLLIAAGLMLIATHPKIVLVVMAYAYLASGFIELALTRFRHRGQPPQPQAGSTDHDVRTATR